MSRISFKPIFTVAENAWTKTKGAAQYSYGWMANVKDAVVIKIGNTWTTMVSFKDLKLVQFEEFRSKHHHFKHLKMREHVAETGGKHTVVALSVSVATCLFFGIGALPFACMAGFGVLFRGGKLVHDEIKEIHDKAACSILEEVIMHAKALSVGNRAIEFFKERMTNQLSVLPEFKYICKGHETLINGVCNKFTTLTTSFDYKNFETNRQVFCDEVVRLQKAIYPEWESKMYKKAEEKKKTAEKEKAESKASEKPPEKPKGDKPEPEPAEMPISPAKKESLGDSAVGNLLPGASPAKPKEEPKKASPASPASPAAAEPGLSFLVEEDDKPGVSFKVEKVEKKRDTVKVVEEDDGFGLADPAGRAEIAQGKKGH